ncbi:MAG TPA: DUF2098 domain-containing protein [Candidatus Methanofastidiosa archaeon]|nr:DUF2098 domain-containing protein [Candidatus Methanofastidiosa archaeon]HPR41220.1 DUF2098 domain-containing protein [Candidatus Methanofastidiosa archaeon]
MIEQGDYARYVNTGTVGKVSEIKEIDGRMFALLEGTDLYYDMEYLEKTDKPVAKKEAIKELDIDKQKEMQEDLQRAIQSGEMSENTGAG